MAVELGGLVVRPALFSTCNVCVLNNVAPGTCPPANNMPMNAGDSLIWHQMWKYYQSLSLL